MALAMTSWAARTSYQFLVMVALVFSACSQPRQPERIARTWSDSAPTIQPEEDYPTGGAEGRVLIRRQERQRISQEPGQGTGPTPFRGYAIYDEKGGLVYQCTECTQDERALPPGKYIAIGVVRYGLADKEEKPIQFVIEPRRTTIVDFSKVRTQPIDEGAKSQPGTPQPGTGHSR